MAKKPNPVPPLGWCTDGVVRPIRPDDDGDTIQVTVTRVFNIRIRDCWCPETHTKELREKEIGEAARDYLAGLLAKAGHDVRVMIDADPTHNPGKTTSFSRFVGDVFLSDGRSVANLMCRAGHAFPTKEALETHLASLGVHGRYVNKRR